MPLIGLGGRAGSGKDTVCSFVKEWGERRHVPVRRAAFADKLKVSAARALGYTGPEWKCISYMNALKETGRVGVQIPGDGDWAVSAEISGRTYLQRFGTEAHRDVFGDSFWIDAALDGYDPSDGELLVVTDCRFPNEAQAVRQHGGLVWRVERPSLSSSSEHVSETPLPDDLVDEVLVNDGTLDELRQCVVARMEQLVAELIA